jgi:16S rRNA processing protein RimM
MLKGGEIRVPRSLALPLMENEYYFQDIYDCEVLTEEGESLGIVTDILQTGANDVYVVRVAEDKPLLIPAIKECVRCVDVAAKRIIVALLPGLREL